MKKKNIVGDNIRRLRSKLGLTQEDLALKSGLSQGYINQLESGKRKFTQKSLELIAEALRVPIGFFFDGEKKDFLVKVPFGDYPELSSDEEDLISFYRRLKNKRYQEFTIALFKSASEILGRRGNIKQS